MLPVDKNNHIYKTLKNQIQGTSPKKVSVRLKKVYEVKRTKIKFKTVKGQIVEDVCSYR